MNHFPVKSLVDLVPQPADPGLYHIGLGIEMIIPDMLHNHGLGNDPSGVTHQEFEKRKLQRLQVNASSFARHFPRQEVDG